MSLMLCSRKGFLSFVGFQKEGEMCLGSIPQTWGCPRAARSICRHAGDAQVCQGGCKSTSSPLPGTVPFSRIREDLKHLKPGRIEEKQIAQLHGRVYCQGFHLIGICVSCLDSPPCKSFMLGKHLQMNFLYFGKEKEKKREYLTSNTGVWTLQKHLDLSN